MYCLLWLCQFNFRFASHCERNEIFSIEDVSRKSFLQEAHAARGYTDKLDDHGELDLLICRLKLIRSLCNVSCAPANAVETIEPFTDKFQRWP